MLSIQICKIDLNPTLYNNNQCVKFLLIVILIQQTMTLLQFFSILVWILTWEKLTNSISAHHGPSLQASEFRDPWSSLILTVSLNLSMSKYSAHYLPEKALNLLRQSVLAAPKDPRHLKATEWIFATQSGLLQDSKAKLGFHFAAQRETAQSNTGSEFGFRPQIWPTQLSHLELTNSVIMPLHFRQPACTQFAAGSAEKTFYVCA